jgi:hypothetical protein
MRQLRLLMRLRQQALVAWDRRGPEEWLEQQDKPVLMRLPMLVILA